MAETIETLGKYEIKRTLGKGAMGVVYEGWDPIIARRVAIKTVKIPDADDPETEEQLARFRREAQAAGRLIHPNIVGVFDYGEANGIAYIVMEYVDGPSVKSLVDKQERFSVPNIMRIMEDLLTGLQFSHERGVVHRDIKPANIMLTSQGQGKIADFGIARIESSSMTQAGTVLGTPAYMSPEQFMGQVVDARTDLYSSGVVLYQLLTGERPFEGGLSAIMHKALNTEPPAPSQIAVTCPAAFDGVVRRAMAKRPEDRYQSATEFLQALRAAASGQAEPAPADSADEATMVSAPRASAPPRPAPTAASVGPTPSAAPAAKKSAMPMIAIAAVLLILLAGGGAWFFLFRGPAPASTAANQTPGAPVIGANAPATTSPPGPSSVAQTTTPSPTANPAPANPPPSTSATGQAATQTASAPTPAAPPPSSPPAPTAPVVQTATVQPPAPAAPVSTPPAPQQEQVAAVSLESVRKQVAQIAAGQRCATLDGDVQSGGMISLSGYAGSSAANAIRQALAGVSTPGGVNWNVVSVDSYYCPVLDLVHPLAATFGSAGARLGLGLAGGNNRLRDGDHILPRLVTADFRGYLRVDYVAHDGGVLHMYPQVSDPANRMTADPPRTFGPSESVNLGETSPGHPAWEVGEPYGTDMIVAIQSSQPLFERPRPSNLEKATDYLRELQAAVDAARQRGVRLAGSAITVETLAK